MEVAMSFVADIIIFLSNPSLTMTLHWNVAVFVSFRLSPFIWPLHVNALLVLRNT